MLNNNDILRRMRYCFDLGDDAMMELFALGGMEVTRAEVSDWLKKDDDSHFRAMADRELEVFLDGFIQLNRGKQEGAATPKPAPLTNNVVLRKIKIALSLRDDDMIRLLKMADLDVSKHEISAFFRHVDHKHYRICQDQILRKFLQGLQIEYRGS